MIFISIWAFFLVFDIKHYLIPIFYWYCLGAAIFDPSHLFLSHIYNM